MKNWYERYYAAIADSAAYSQFCVRVFDKDLGQHGFADAAQVQLLQESLHIQPGERILDIGCGTGGIVAGIAAETGAQAIGLDYIEKAAALGRSRYGTARMQYVVADMVSFCFSPSSFDVVISIDSIFFRSIPPTIAALTRLLSASGRMGILYTHGADPEYPLPTFDRSELPPDSTPLAHALQINNLDYATQDLTNADYEHALLKKSVLQELRTDFQREGNEFLFDNRYGEADGVLSAIDAGAHARYLYIVTKPGA